MHRAPIKTAMLLGLLATSAWSALAYAQDELVGRAEVNWRYGNDRSILMTEFWVPFLQEDDSVLYGDVRIMGDNQENHEFNLGVGYREIAEVLGQKGVAGAHGWIDRRITKRGSTFHQATLGTEWLGEDFDMRMNGYIPLSEEKTYEEENTTAGTAQLSGTGLFIDTNKTVLEEPQYGMDLELGLNLDFMKEHTESTRIYAGGFYFDGDNTESVAGWRTRFTSDITPDVQLGARFQRDDVRGSQGFLEATVRFPFGHKKSYRKEGIRARLDESPERDIDIVTNDVVTDAGQRVQVLNAATGETQKILHVDNSAAGGGDGSVENPFDSLAAAEAAAEEHTIIYVNRGDGGTTNQAAGITLSKTGQQLIGSGVDFVYDSGRFKAANGNGASGNLTIVAATTAPMITNGGGIGVSVTADDVSIAGVTVNNANTHGINISNANNVSVSNVTLNNNTGNGLRVVGDADTSSNITVSNSTANGNVSGFSAYAQNAGTLDDVTFTGNTANSNTSNGFLLETTGAGSQTGTLSYANNTADGNTTYGFYTVSSASSSIDTVNFTDNISRNGQNTNYHVRSSNGEIKNTTLTGNSSDGATLHGIRILATSGGDILNAVANNNTVTASANSGLRIESTGAGSTIQSTTLDSNTLTNNTSYGILTFAQSNSDIGQVDVTNNNATLNGQGISLTTSSSGSVTTSNIINNTASSNTTNGIFLTMSGGSTVTNSTVEGNTTTGNTAAGIRQETSNGTTEITNSTFNKNITTGNGTYGLLHFTSSGSTATNVDITNNTVSNNSNYGIWAIANGTSTTSNLTISENTLFKNVTQNVRVQSTGAGSTIANATISNNTSDGDTSTAYGYLVYANDSGAITQATLSDNTSTQNSTYGYWIYADDAGVINTTNMNNNAASNNASEGYRLESILAGSNIANINADGNTSTNNTNGGYTIFGNAGDIGTTSFTNNTASQNGTSGFWLYAINGSTLTQGNFTGNTASNNGGPGFTLQANQATASIGSASYVNNIATGSGGSGFETIMTNDADIGQVLYQGNTASSNTSNGILINDDSAANNVVVDLGGGALGSTGGNRVFGNTSQDIFVDLDGAELKAESNWWGDATGLDGGETTLQDGSTIDSAPFLTEDPSN